MTGPHPAVADCRRAVRRALTGLTPAGAAADGSAEGAVVLVACSGGPDSLALADATAFAAPRLGLRAGAVVVDHGLQPGSAEVAARAAATCADLGLDPVVVRRVEVDAVGVGPEAAAREARYAALEDAARTLSAAAVLLGHTREDQAETVLLRLARGSGARSLAGMPARRDVFLRPLLDVPRHVTAAACEARGLTPWSDPHNEDPAYLRVRARAALADLERDLGPGVAAALARSADLLRDDADALDTWAATAAEAVRTTPGGEGEGAAPGAGAMAGSGVGLRVDALTGLPPAVRRRVLLRAALDAGCPPGSVSATHVAALDALVADWRGQGPVSLPGRVAAHRACGTVTLSHTH